MHNKVKPKTLYKLRSWSNQDKKIQANHRMLLEENKLWVPVASDLNDPFDCSIPFRFDLMRDDEFQVRVERILAEANPSIQPAELTIAARQLGKGSDLRDPARRFEALKRLAWAYADTHGILSFTTIRDDPLLWSHYANCHKGFCIGFDYDRLSIVLDRFLHMTGVPSPGRWIDYVKEMPVIIPCNDDGADVDAYLRLLTIKSDHWNYEKEYRYVFSRWKDEALEFDASCVSEVILGSKISDQDRDEIPIIVRERFPGAKLLQAHKKQFAFELEFTPLD